MHFIGLLIVPESIIERLEYSDLDDAERRNMGFIRDYIGDRFDKDVEKDLLWHFGVSRGMERLMAPYQENNFEDCPKEYLEFFEDEDLPVDEETGKRGRWENPNRKWDYYNKIDADIPSKDGTRPIVCVKRNIDMDAVYADIDEKINRFWNRWQEYVEQGPGELLGDERSFDQKFDVISVTDIAKDFGLLKTVKDEDTYNLYAASRSWKVFSGDCAVKVGNACSLESYKSFRDRAKFGFSPFRAYSVVTVDGWYEDDRHNSCRSQRGDFLSSIYERFVAPMGDDDVIARVNYHI